MPLINKNSSAPNTHTERKQARDCEHLAAELENPDPLARRWAARDLGYCEHASAALVSRLSREEDMSVREVILSSLTSLGDDIAIRGLAECLRSENTALRNEAIEVMKQMPQALAPIMRGLLNDADSDVRIFAVNILETLCHADVVTWLIEVIEHDDNVNVCATALDLLVEVGTFSTKEPLLRPKARFAQEPYIQFAVDIALKRLFES